MQRIQIHLLEKRKPFPEFFYTFFKSTSNFELLQKKMNLRNDGPQRTWLDKCLKSPV